MRRLKIERDEDAQNPRTEWDNASTMACWHRRYTLGDVQPDISPDEYRNKLVRDLTPSALDNPCTCHHEDSRQVDHDDEDRCYRCGGSFSERDAAADLFETHFIALPLYLYDHSGITISTGAFSCPWDSGQVGFIYMARTKAAEEWPEDTEERAVACMKSEVEVYDDYLTGNVHGYIVEVGTPFTRTYSDGREPTTGIDWEQEDSCWGFYGDWWKEGDPTGIGDNFDDETKAIFDRMTWSDEGEWQYTDDVPEDERED